jgi:hypothetical protein
MIHQLQLFINQVLGSIVVIEFLSTINYKFILERNMRKTHISIWSILIWKKLICF